MKYFLLKTKLVSTLVLIKNPKFFLGKLRKTR